MVAQDLTTTNGTPASLPTRNLSASVPKFLGRSATNSFVGRIRRSLSSKRGLVLDTKRRTEQYLTPHEKATLFPSTLADGDLAHWGE